MNDSVYAPPKSDLSQSGEVGSTGDKAFYVVSTRKFALLFFVTLGMYRIYWFYENWRRHKVRCRATDSEGQDVWPIPRAIFSVFFVHSLFYAIDEYATEELRPLQWKVDAHASVLVLLLILSTIFGRLWDKDIGSPTTGVLWMATVVAIYVNLRRAQLYINSSCGDSQGISNSALTGANWVWLAVGGIFWAMVVIGLLLPDVPA